MTTTLHPIVVGTPTDDGQPLQLGALVTYHGRRRGHQYAVFYVQHIDEDGHTLVDRDYQTEGLRNVSRGNIRPTGTVVALCDCGHEAGSRDPRGPYGKWCDGLCGCDRHDFERTEEN